MAGTWSLPSAVLSRSAPRAKAAPLVVGLRREDPTRIWERRSPLTPDAVKRLVSERNVRVHVEHCDRRVFRDHEYSQAGAIIKDNLNDAHIIVGIKETPVSELITTPVQDLGPGKMTARTHLMFSHTAKGQTYNTALLSRFIANDPVNGDPSLPRLIDYEHLTDAEGKRTVGFGWFAGVAGVLESLSAMAHSHLEIGVASPFIYTPRPHSLPSLDKLRASLREIGERIANEGTPKKLGPFIVGLTGTGNVTNGCLSILAELPTEHISVKDLGALVNQQAPNLRKIYLVHAKPQDYLRRLDGGNYDRAHYYKNPHVYQSTFATTVAPYLTLFLNGVGWAPSFPRLMTSADLIDTLSRAKAIGGARFTNIGDISCDPGGGLEFLPRSSTLSAPFYKTRPSTLPAYLPSIQMMAVDILPASIPLDASQHFSSKLYPYLEDLIEWYCATAERRTGQLALDPALEKATIAAGGQLKKTAPPTTHTVTAAELPADGVEVTATTSEGVDGEVVVTPMGVLRKKKVLLLGSGMVAGPAVDEIARREDVQLLIASNSYLEASRLAQHYTNVAYQVVDLKEEESWAGLVAEADVVISLLPAGFHTTVAQQCIKHRKHMVTASYISPAMQALNEEATKADILILNEIGLDPGIDHCSAISLVNKLKAEGKQIVSFTSFCGGLPSPDASFVPLRYKFSWSPRGVLTAALNGAKYKLANDASRWFSVPCLFLPTNAFWVQIYSIPENRLLRSYFPSVPISEEFKMEGLPNRDSLPYLSTYNLGWLSNVRTLLRGTLRYPGFSRLMESFRAIGFLEVNQTIHLESWSSFVVQSLAVQVPLPKNDLWSVKAALREAINDTEDIEDLHSALEWLSLLPSGTAPAAIPMPPLPAESMAPLDIFAYLLSFKLRYAPHERDMVVLAHEVIAQKKGSSEEVHHSTLITYGTPKATAMARTVGMPVAIAALNVLDGKVAIRGVAGPTDPSVYTPVLQGMEEVGLGMKEAIHKGRSIEGSLVPGVRVSAEPEPEEEGEEVEWAAVP
ncbi:Alpha-aminoadipic semialdehyde synthase, mitochondrial [Mycena venus]|uniref:Alpha-aminoadipic semialdehyde synthase, mitochondrial n=1 Tax=Mycena venus TaxID=2733690 RepID=A0A8H6YVZ6_9AGAR|nr:Alpha-aminoadipic semialdehyde synthase, mitochondrial [Mycena venus]